MAALTSGVANTVFGNYRVIVQKITTDTDTATMDVSTGLNFVEWAVVQELGAGKHPSITLNTTNAGTATLGTVAIKSATTLGSHHLISFGY